MRSTTFILIFLFSLSILACDGKFSIFSDLDDPIGHISNERPQCDECKILFIGSSYLNYAGQNVMEIFSWLAEEGEKSVYIRDRSIGGWRMPDHAQSQETIDLINEEKWDYVILQGNSAVLSQEKWQDQIIPYLVELRKIIKKNSPKTCVIYMMPWAYLDGLAWIPGETDTYEQMQINLYNETIEVVNDIDIATAPAGWIWYTLISEGYDPYLLYLNDYNHQARSGAYLTACVFYSTIYLEQAPRILFEWADEDEPHLLHQVAYSTVVDSLELWNIY